jgi:hypothetical protein
MQTFPEIIALWPSAEALGVDVGVSGVVARAWRQRNSIPPEHWLGIVTAAERRGFLDTSGRPVVTLELLAHIAAQKLPHNPPAHA